MASIGKLRGLQQLSTPEGILCILALDQRGTLQRMMEAAGWQDASYPVVVQLKMEILQRLAPLVSGVLLDPLYSAAQAIAGGVLPGRVGLMVALEAGGYEAQGPDRLARVLDGWSVEKIKAMGASAVKLLVHYHPERTEAARHQQRLVEQVAAECRRWDIPFLLEPVLYAPTEREEEDLRRRRAELVAETARQLGRFPVDVLKLQFPVDPEVVPDGDAWEEACRRVTEASPVPWALLSAGAPYDVFARQLEAACRAGASGFVAGRAIWQEAVQRRHDEEVRRRFLDEEMPLRIRRLVDIARRHGRPWPAVASHAHRLDMVGPDWYRTYREG